MTRQHTRLLGWSVALLLAAAFAALGHWQLQRMHAKQALLERSAQARTRLLPLALALRSGTVPAWVEGRGRFLPERLLLDNQTRAGQVGLRVYQPVLVEGVAAPLLVDLGWLPWPGDRRLPAMPVLDGTVALRGLLVPPPSAGVALGPAMAPAGPSRTWLATRIAPGEVAAALGRRDISPQVLRLDPALPLGFARDLELLPNTLPPARHLAYAVQWFGLALAVLVTAALLEWRARQRRRRRQEARP